MKIDSKLGDKLIDTNERVIRIEEKLINLEKQIIGSNSEGISPRLRSMENWMWTVKGALILLTTLVGYNLLTLKGVV